jgi:hypothetical protein
VVAHAMQLMKHVPGKGSCLDTAKSAGAVVLPDTLPQQTRIMQGPGNVSKTSALPILYLRNQTLETRAVSTTAHGLQSRPHPVREWHLCAFVHRVLPAYLSGHSLPG